ncbi:hypothetical protein MMC20_005847 [Loxospora ochrophaea]|nr:hypothetical protein [Loxospora ochrophaea]
MTTTTAVVTSALTTVPATTQTSSFNATVSATVTNGTTTLSTTKTVLVANITSTTTISTYSGAPTGPPTFMQIPQDINWDDPYAISDNAQHLTDNYNLNTSREVFIVSNAGQLYSVSHNAYYYIKTPAGGDKLYWSTNSSLGSTNFYQVALNDGTGRSQVFLNYTTKNAPFQFCICNTTSGDVNAAAGFHVYYYYTSGTQPSYCYNSPLYLVPV